MKYYEKVCLVCNKTFPGTKRARFCSDKCKSIYLKEKEKIVCIKCGKIDVAPRYQYGRCYKCYRAHKNAHSKKYLDKFKKTNVKTFTTWDEYSEWRKSNPNKSYGDFQTEKRKNNGDKW